MFETNKLILEKIEDLETKIEIVKKHASGFHKKHNPVTKDEIHSLVKEISSQPYKIGQEETNLALRLEQKIEKVELLVSDIQKLL